MFFEITLIVLMCRNIAKNEKEGPSSWGDLVEVSDSRPPGRAVQMHKKLSSPSRKRFVLISKFLDFPFSSSLSVNNINIEIITFL